MGTPRRRRKVSRVPPDAVEARVTRFGGRWFVRLDKSPAYLWPVSRQDAWNFDVYEGAIVYVRTFPGGCAVLQKQGNKRYVKI